MKIKIIIADKSILNRKGIKLLLAEAGQFEILKEISDWESVIRSVNKNQPDYLVVNYNLIPDKKHQSIISYFNKNIKINVVIIHDEEISDNIIAQCITTINIVDEETKIINSLKRVFNDNSGPNKKESSELSRRENAVIKCISLGMTNKEIAENLYISTHTVIAHRKNITRKLGIKTVSGLTVYAILNKLVKLEEIEQF